MPTEDSLLHTISSRLVATQTMVAVAESCTGGLLAGALTQLPGSSAWFDCGLVTYSNEAKQALLGVTANILALHGAVSEETAQAMAEGVLKNSQAVISLAITGIAGPDGGSAEKPVGTVWFAVARKNTSTITRLKQFRGSRNRIRKNAVRFALYLLCESLP